MEVKLNLNGNWLLTASRDHLCKLFDIRNLKEELQVFRGHKKEATGEGCDVLCRVFWGLAPTVASHWSCLIFSGLFHSCSLASCPRRTFCQRRVRRLLVILARWVRIRYCVGK